MARGQGKGPELGQTLALSPLCFSCLCHPLAFSLRLAPLMVTRWSRRLILGHVLVSEPIVGSCPGLLGPTPRAELWSYLPNCRAGSQVASGRQEGSFCVVVADRCQ